MKLPEKEQQEIILGTAKESMFSIDSSNSVIFEILRDKMYSNKIGAVAREVASNSRDANREAKSEKNIEIEFTNDNFLSAIGDTSIIFRDFGIGISTDRMENVFLKYAASTKRDSNTQTGGFGLGAKTPFAYTDSFVVRTVCDYAEPIYETQMIEEDVLNEYSGEIIGTKIIPKLVIIDYKPSRRLEFVYNAIIDATGKGKMISISEEETDKETGTQIIIPILTNDDRYKFEREVYKSTMHWIGITYINFRTTKPVVEYVIEEKDFRITNYTDANFIGLLDGIPYEIKPENAEAIVGYTVFLNLDLEKLTINANRESLQYDEQTIKHVNEVYNIFLTNLEGKLKDFLNINESFLKAYDKAKRLKDYHNDETKLQCLFRTLKTNTYGSFNYNVTFNGENVGKISLQNHSIVYVKWLGTASKYTQSTLSLEHPIVYLDRGGIKLPKNQKLDKFYLIKPDKSIAKDILEKEKEYLLGLGVELINYSEVKPDKAYVRPIKNDKIKIYLRSYSNPHNSKHEKYFDKTLKTIIGLDPDKNFFVPISDFRSHYNFRNSNFSNDKLRILNYKKRIENIFYVNDTAFKKYLEPNGYKRLQDVYKTVDLKEFTKYVEINRIKNTINDIPSIIRENFPEILPISIIKFMNDTQEEIPDVLKGITWQNLGFQPSKFNYSGVVKKYEDNVKVNYPLLPAYLSYHVKNKEEKIKNIKKYIELTKK